MPTVLKQGTQHDFTTSELSCFEYCFSEHRFLHCDLVEAERRTSLGFAIEAAWQPIIQCGCTAYLQGLDVTAC